MQMYMYMYMKCICIVFNLDIFICAIRYSNIHVYLIKLIFSNVPKSNINFI